MYFRPMCAMSPTRVSWLSWNRHISATRAGSTPPIMASTEPVTPTRKECSATDSGCLLPVNHQPVRATRLSTPISEMKLAVPCVVASAMRSSGVSGWDRKRSGRERAPADISPDRRRPDGEGTLTSAPPYGAVVAQLRATESQGST